MLDDPVRGSLPDPGFYSLSGLEQMRAFQQGLLPGVPLHRLIGFRLTQVDSGVVAYSLPYLDWLQFGDGTVDLSILIELACWTAVTTVTPGGSEPQMRSLSVQYMRPATLKSQSVLARARVLNMGPRFTVVEAVVEDALGRETSRALGSAVVRPMDPAPPPLTTPLRRVDEPTYGTPDPYLRSESLGNVLRPDEVDDAGGWGAVSRAWAAGDLAHPPIADLFGVRCRDASEGTSLWTMRTSRWLCCDRPYLQAGTILTLARCALTSASASLCGPGRVTVVLSDSLSIFRPVVPDGNDITAEASIAPEGDLSVASVRVSDHTGRLIATGSQAALVADRGRAQRPPDAGRVLLTVLFSDIVGSTERAEKVGDTRWRDLLDEHHTVVRKQLDVFKGREVKTTGDGFLATFNSPGRAVQCARAIREAVRRLGLEVRVGLHTGECEVSGADVAGIAVHIASRVQTLAGPGEVLVSGTVRDLVTGSGLRFTDRGRHALKGIEGDWPLYALES